MPIRIDKYLAINNPNLSRALIQKYIKLGYVKVDNKIVNENSHLVNETSSITLNIPKKSIIQPVSLPIIFENSDVIVIDKPAGVLSHSKGSENNEYTVADFFKKLSSYGLNTNRPGIVHRLDRDTSGVMLGVKNERTAKFISKQFSNRSVKKVYYALVEGCPSNLMAIIDMPIARNPKLPSQFRVDINGKTAKTEYEVIEVGSKYSLVKLMPSTGRTHQLRVHMSHIGHPILGDKVYGHKASRLFLHAFSLEITIPGSQRMIFESPLPVEFKKTLK